MNHDIVGETPLEKKLRYDYLNSKTKNELPIEELGPLELARVITPIYFHKMEERVPKEKIINNPHLTSPTPFLHRDGTRKEIIPFTELLQQYGETIPQELFTRENLLLKHEDPEEDFQYPHWKITLQNSKVCERIPWDEITQEALHLRTKKGNLYIFNAVSWGTIEHVPKERLTKELLQESVYKKNNITLLAMILSQPHGADHINKTLASEMLLKGEEQALQAATTSGEILKFSKRSLLKLEPRIREYLTTPNEENVCPGDPHHVLKHLKDLKKNLRQGLELEI